MNFMEKEKPIGVFDSGIGGLTVVKEIMAKLPNERIIYFGDTARVPYGSKSNETVIEYSLQDAAFLVQKNVKIIVVACNTASSVAIPALREKFTIPVVGMIEAGSAYAANESKEKKIGVIGTRSTISNRSYSKELKRIDPEFDVFEKACPLFVPLAEEGWIDHNATLEIAEEYLRELKELSVDTLLLGCTHYPILKPVIQKVMGEKVKLIDSGVAAAQRVAAELDRIGLRSNSNGLGVVSYYVSDIPSTFEKVASLFLGKPVSHVTKVDTESLARNSK
ncbi:MAG: glutamate racemase [Ignavibacteriales bacterium]|nr:MAG: glutamate racemase [Ignavibacteriales bacterium]